MPHYGFLIMFRYFIVLLDLVVWGPSYAFGFPLGGFIPGKRRVLDDSFSLLQSAEDEHSHLSQTCTM